MSEKAIPLVEEINSGRDNNRRAIELVNGLDSHIRFPSSGRQNNAPTPSCFLPGDQGFGLVVVRLASIKKRIIQRLPAGDSIVDRVLPKPGEQVTIVIGLCSPFAMAPKKDIGEIFLF